MLNENIKAIRKSKGLSQQELAVKLNVVRQTVSKWEQGLSVPDNQNHQLNWWYAQALKGHITGERLKAH